jgi:hypothetical protein
MCCRESRRDDRGRDKERDSRDYGEDEEYDRRRHRERLDGSYQESLSRAEKVESMVEFSIFRDSRFLYLMFELEPTRQLALGSVLAGGGNDILIFSEG